MGADDRTHDQADDHAHDPIRRAAQYRVDREAAKGAGRIVVPGEPTERAGAEGASEQADTSRRRMDDRALWVDTVVDQAIRRGEFDNLPLEGKPIPGLKGSHDPDWWLKSLVEREQITGILPAAQLRKDDAELDDELDRESSEQRVREVVEEFNARVIDARRQLMGGPPVVTPTRDVEREVESWHRRRSAQNPRTADPRPPDAPARPQKARRRPWWRSNAF